MKSGKSFILVLMLLCVLPSEARKRHTINISQDYQSVVVNEDSTRYTDLRSKRVKMKRESDLYVLFQGEWQTQK